MTPPKSIASRVERRPSLIALFSAFSMTSVGLAAPFTAGNLAIYRVGSGTGSLVNTGNPVFIDEYTPTGSLVQSVAMPTTATGAQKPLVASGTATSEGLMSRSSDGQYLILPGYGSTLPAASSLSGTASTAVNRVIGRVDFNGSIDTSTALTDAATGNNPRSAASSDGTVMWITGGAGGIRSCSLGGTTSIQLSTTVTNLRQVNIFDGQLYVSDSSGTAVRLGTVGTSLPTTAGQTIVNLPGFPVVGSQYGFFLADLTASVAGVDTLYVVDDTTTGVGGIFKYSLVGGSWVSNGSVGAAADGYRGLTASISGTAVTLYSTRKGGSVATGGGELVSLADTSGYNGTITGTPTLLATAIANTGFRGVAPVPAPPSRPDLTASISAPASALAGSNFDYTITASNAGAANATAVALDFTLPAGLTFVSATGNNGFTGANSSGVIHFTGGALNAGASATLTVTVTTSNAADYTAAIGSTVIDPANSIAESNEGNNSNTAVATVNVAALPLVTIAATDASASEAGTDPGTFRISRTGSTTNALTVNYTVANGTGQATSADYSPSLTGTAIIPAGQSFVDITITPVDDVVLEGDETITLSVLDTADYDLGAVVTDTVTIADNETQIDLSRYVRVGRYDLPEPTRTVPPTNSLLCQEASNVTYNWDTDTLFITGDGGTSVVQVSKTGQLIDSMTLAPGSSPQGTEFYDTEGLTYIGGGKFVMTEERDRQLNQFTYVAGGTLTRAAAKTVKLGTTIGNIGLEGVCYDPMTSGATPGFIVVKEKSPKSIFQTNVDFTALTATNGSPTATGSTDLFSPSLVPTLDFSDVFAMSNLPALAGKPAASHLLIISQESGQIVHCDRSGNIVSTLTLVGDAGNPLTIPDQTHEGVTMDRNGIIYSTSENGGGDSNHPQLWVWAPSTATDLPPTSVVLNNTVPTIPDSTSTVVPVKMADIVVVDDGLGVNNLSVSGADAASFEITGTSLFLKAGTVLNATTKSSYSVAVNVDGVGVGSAVDASTNYTLSVTVATGGTAQLIISEVAPWSSSNSSLGADWFEVTNIGTATANISGYTVDDNSNSFAVSLPLQGVTNIAPGESVIFVESATDVSAAFKSIWFGANAPANLQVGHYSGSGIGLSTGGDAVNIFDAGGTLQANVSFGTNVGSAGTFQSFDNATGLNNTPISTMSAVGVNGAFSVTDTIGLATNTLTGSPGTIGASSSPLISITATDANAAETASDPGTFRVTRTGSTISPLTFSYLLSGTASSADYSPTLNGSGTILSGQSFVDITITPVDDALNEGDETLTMTLGDTGSYDVGTPSVATVTIIDNDNPNQAPTSVTLGNTVPTLVENTSTTSDVRVADITIVDDIYGTNVLSLSGADASSFTISGNSLFLKAGTTLSFATKPAYNVTVNVDDATLGITPDASTNFTLSIAQTVPAGSIIITEVAPFSSAIAAIGADWFEVTNVGTTSISTAGWKMDDNSNAFVSAVPMSTLTIAPGQTVIFLETTDLPGKSAAFKTAWFGGNPPANIQFGSYTGSGVGLSGAGDAVNLFDAGGTRFAGVAFGASATVPPFLTFDNKAALNSTTLPLPVLSTFSAVGTNGAFAAKNDSTEIGSPGTTVTPTFLGVAAGDADSSSAILWTRTNEGVAYNVTAQVATDLAFTSPVSFSALIDETKDYTVKVSATGLASGTKFFYRFVINGSGETSGVGTFKTAPAANASSPLHFAFSGDNDGLMRPYALASVIPSQNLDFYVNLGDVIYENASNLTASGAHNGAPWLNSPSVTLSNDSLSFNGVPRAIPSSGAPFATSAQLKADYAKKYRENFLPVNAGGQNSLQVLYAAQGNYTTWDNHELGNRKYIDGGSPAGGSVGGAAGTDMPTGRGVDARDNGAGNPANINDVNTSSTDIMNRSTGFQTLRDVFLNYQPMADRGTISAPSDPRTDGSKRLYSAQQWGKNATYINTDARSYRDIRLKTASASADDTSSPRADNPNRTYLGATQLAWLKQTLLDAQNNGTTWKFVSISDPIDQLGPIGGALTGTLTSVNADGGKAFMGGYRAERNALLKFIVDNHITNVVFMATDDHQNRINELSYSPTGQTAVQSSYVKVPFCFSIVCGPLGATGPDTITDHTFGNIKAIADSLANAQTGVNVDPIGLENYPGLHNLYREGDATADSSPQPVDFYSPDTFNFTTLDVSADGKTLSVTSTGMNATAQNAGTEYTSGPQARTVFSFKIDAPTDVQIWRAAKFGTTSTAGNLANEGDYDSDGVQNLVEYALGIDPTSGVGSNGPSALPVALSNDADALLTDRLALSFALPNPAPSDITYRVQASDDLGTWSDVASKSGNGPWTWLGGGTSHIVTTGSGPVMVKIGDIVPSSGNPKRMMRLKVTNP